MKEQGKRICAALLLGLVLPGMGAFWGGKNRTGPEEHTAPPGQKVENPAASVWMNREIPIYMGEAPAETMSMEDYLTGVVLAEMPAEFHEEALKAQCVVSATYTLRRLRTGDRHGGRVCTDPRCCQGFLAPEDFLRRGGSREDVEKVRRAVAETDGLVLTYEGELIEATFFSCTGGSTEAAVEVWGGDVPYLQATPSPGEEMAAHYRDTVEFSRQELEQALDVTLSGNPETWFSGLRRTAGGGVAEVFVGKTAFSGVSLRKKLELRSTAFSVEPGDNSVRITTSGFGHRVGMSQYGAQAMALDGRKYPEILAHYYQGTKLSGLEH